MWWVASFIRKRVKRSDCSLLRTLGHGSESGEPETVVDSSDRTGCVRSYRVQRPKSHDEVVIRIGSVSGSDIGAGALRDIEHAASTGARRSVLCDAAERASIRYIRGGAVERRAADAANGYCAGLCGREDHATFLDEVAYERRRHGLASERVGEGIFS